jgi:hypothetical protein
MMTKGMKGKGKGKGKGKKGEGKDGGKSQVQAKLARGEQIYSGTIRSFIADKKSGFIVCQDIMWQCGQDVYAFEEVLQRGNSGPGDTVAFFVHWSSKGQPQASSPMLRLAKQEGDFACVGTFKKPDKEGAEHAFIEHADSKEFFGRDVYVHKDMANTANPGDTIKFNMYLNRDGMPNVSNMEIAEPGWEPTPSDLSETVHVELPEKGKGKGKGGKDKGMGKAMGKMKGKWEMMMGMQALGWGPY